MAQRMQLKNIIMYAIDIAETCFSIECVYVLRLAFVRETWSLNRYSQTLVFQTNRKSCCIVTTFDQICKISVYYINDLARMWYRVEAPHYCAVIIKEGFTNEVIAHQIAHAIIELLITSHMFPELRLTALQIEKKGSIVASRID